MSLTWLAGLDDYLFYFSETLSSLSSGYVAHRLVFVDATYRWLRPIRYLKSQVSTIIVRAVTLPLHYASPHPMIPKKLILMSTTWFAGFDDIFVYNSETLIPFHLLECDDHCLRFDFFQAVESPMSIAAYTFRALRNRGDNPVRIERFEMKILHISTCMDLESYTENALYSYETPSPFTFVRFRDICS